MKKNTNSLFNRVWNSKAMDNFADITMGTLEFLGECICDAFSNNNNTSYTTNNSSTSYSNNNTNTTSSVEDETYNYWMSLSSCEQEDYFNNNYKLQEYGENYRYDNRDQMARSIASIARRENRSFTDKYDRY